MTQGLLLLVVGPVVACRRQRTLMGGERSALTLAQEVVAALDRGDRSRLEALEVSEGEFHEVVWPHLPAARPERNLPWDYVWGDLHSKSRYHLTARLGAWKRGALRVASVAFQEPSTDYGTYSIHRRSLLTCVDATGTVVDMSVFGSVVEQDGRFKLLSYVVD